MIQPKNILPPPFFIFRPPQKKFPPQNPLPGGLYLKFKISIVEKKYINKSYSKFGFSMGNVPSVKILISIIEKKI